MSLSIWLSLAAAVLALVGTVSVSAGVTSAVVTVIAIFVGRNETRRARTELLAEIKKASDDGRAFSFFVS